MNDISFILPLDAWAYLLGINGCKALWCFPDDCNVKTRHGLEYLLNQGLAITDGARIFVDPYLLQISKELADGSWCVSLEYCNNFLSIGISSTSYLSIRKISSKLFCVQQGTDQTVFLQPILEAIMEQEWDHIRLKLATQSRIIGWIDVPRESFPDTFYRVFQKGAPTNGG